MDITFLAVSKVIVAVVFGAFASRSVPNGATTMRDFSFTITNLILPCLTIANTAKSVNLQVFFGSIVLVLFAFILVSMGILSAIAMSSVLFRRKSSASTGVPETLRKDVHFEVLYDVAEPAPTHTQEAPDSEEDAEKKKKPKKKKKSEKIPYVAIVLSDSLKARGVTGHEVVPLLSVPDRSLEDEPAHFWAAIVGCSIQNTVTLPLSLIQSIMSSVAWVDLAAATAYIFVFSIVCTLYLWACGPYYLDFAQRNTWKLKFIRQCLERHCHGAFRCDATTQTEVKPDSSASPTGHEQRFPVPPSAGAVRVQEGGKEADAAREEQPAAPFDPFTASNIAAMASASAAAPLPSQGLSRHMSHISVATLDAGTDPIQISEVTSQADLESCSPDTFFKCLEPTPVIAEQIPYTWEKNTELRVMYMADLHLLKQAAKGSTVARVRSAVANLLKRLVTNVPFMAIVISIFIGITPPVRALFFDNGPLSMFMDAITLVAEGCIPCSLMMLGANLMGSTKAPQDADDDTVLVRDFEQNTEFPLYELDLALLGEDVAYAEEYNKEHVEIDAAPADAYVSMTRQEKIKASAAEREKEGARAAAAAAAAENADMEDTDGNPRAAKKVSFDDTAAEPKKASWIDGVTTALSMTGISKRFIWGIITVRLLVTPCISFIVLILFTKYFPNLFHTDRSRKIDKTLVLVLFTEIAAPSAINSALLFNQRGFMTYPWAKMLFFQYILCAITMVMWTSMGLQYVLSL